MCYFIVTEIPIPGDMMRYQETQPQPESNKVASILGIVNFLLFIVIVVSFNYLVIDFLF
jgi:hypothetical protein